MSEQDFGMSGQMQEMKAQIAVLRTELDSLKQHNRNLPLIEPPVPIPLSKRSSTRRKTLKRLALALLGGAAAATISGFSVSEAKIVVNPASGGGKIGTLVALPGEPVPTNAPGVSMGLVSTDGVSLDLSLLPSKITTPEFWVIQGQIQVTGLLVLSPVRIVLVFKATVL